MCNPPKVVTPNDPWTKFKVVCLVCEWLTFKADDLGGFVFVCLRAARPYDAPVETAVEKTANTECEKKQKHSKIFLFN